MHTITHSIQEAVRTETSRNVCVECDTFFVLKFACTATECADSRIRTCTNLFAEMGRQLSLSDVPSFRAGSAALPWQPTAGADGTGPLVHKTGSEDSCRYERRRRLVPGGTDTVHCCLRRLVPAGTPALVPDVGSGACAVSLTTSQPTDSATTLFGRGEAAQVQHTTWSSTWRSGKS